MSEIRGAVAVITGAGSGIGRALAQEIASRGAHLALADVSEAGLEETRKLLGSAIARNYIVDVSIAEQVQNFARSVEQDFGRASLLINNAGVALYGTFAELAISEIDWLIGINLWGVIHGCKFFLPLLQREKDAHIVNISSVLGLVGTPGQVAYSTSKFAVRGFSEALREELRPTGIRITCVHPAGINTPIAEKARAGAATNNQERVAALTRFAKVLTIPPQVAAQKIVAGIVNNKNRVLIGADAYRIDAMARVAPTRASAMVTRRTLRQMEAQPVAGGT